MAVSIHSTVDSSFQASQPDRFPACYTCGQYSPFLIYLGYNKKSIKFRPEAKHIQLFCPICSPHPDLYRQFHPDENLFRADSILNDQRLLRLLKDFVYPEPNDEQYASKDRVIITENSQLCSSYKAVTKRKAPKSIKLGMLMDLFPETHRMPNKNYTTEDQLFEEMQQKYHNICLNYMNISEAGGSRLIDNFDLLIDKTPLVVGQRQQSRTAVYAAPTIQITEANAEEVPLYDSDREIRAMQDSDEEGELVSLASAESAPIFFASVSDTSIVNEVQISSEEPAGHWDIQPSQSQSQSQSHQQSVVFAQAGQSLSSQSQSVNISSQSVVGAQKSDLSYGTESTTSSSESCIVNISLPRPATSRRKPSSADDGQQPGPSNIKRRRVSPRASRPVNPTPEEIQRNPHQGGRLPRVDGG